mmetsp:Transcript_107870/g.170353  ORF Transcript_107870/g.170353 Transcript_107870/m.170353 type:complete len:168 (+) Transcript_107870:71-574(+)
MPAEPVELEEWLDAMRMVAANADRKHTQLPPLPDISKATKQEKAVFLLMRGISAAELGDMSAAETMVRYALKLSPELSSPMREWPTWAKDIARRMLEVRKCNDEIGNGRVCSPSVANSDAVVESENKQIEPAIVGSPAILVVGLLVLGIVASMWMQSRHRRIVSRSA